MPTAECISKSSIHYGFKIEQCEVDTIFLYDKRNVKIDMELSKGLRELLIFVEEDEKV
ncbi:hypothetical protein PPTG_21109 [Phytophthora nicotianae INRA-310]|uniref:Reverse transcriptase Ty1/copia-type domain-containing protein n=1 Tax=Phytophthora nicotianae (strain INRA-310) TaxID=761204 RepID=W2R8D3_PHYN3|nr:hypothetical protein PPTG_21109 [Phytophthora nicotianae INRA-310]ETN21663.1 hypothetical protein PPTG_21109 [Phytophthora nicotianae INRA-310]